MAAEESSPKMTFLSHFVELRNRLLVSVVALAVTTIASFTFSQTLAEFLSQPIGGLDKLSSIDVTENVAAFMKISLLSGVTLALPVIVFEILGFVMPGLKRNERFWVWLALPTATLFFIGGVAFAYYFMLPTALPFLLDFMGITTSPRPSNYFGFVTNLLFWVGVSFELPLVVFVLAKLKGGNSETITQTMAHCFYYRCSPCSVDHANTRPCKHGFDDDSTYRVIFPEYHFCGFRPNGTQTKNAEKTIQSKKDHFDCSVGPSHCRYYYLSDFMADGNQNSLFDHHQFHCSHLEYYFYLFPGDCCAVQTIIKEVK